MKLTQEITFAQRHSLSTVKAFRTKNIDYLFSYLLLPYFLLPYNRVYANTSSNWIVKIESTGINYSM